MKSAESIGWQGSTLRRDTRPSLQEKGSGSFSHRETTSATSVVSSIMKPFHEEISDSGSSVLTGNQAQLDPKGGVGDQDDAATKESKGVAQPSEVRNRPIRRYAIRALSVVVTLISTPVLIVGTTIGLGVLGAILLSDHLHSSYKTCPKTVSFGAGLFFGAVGGLAVGPFVAVVSECVLLKDIIIGKMCIFD